MKLKQAYKLSLPIASDRMNKQDKFFKLLINWYNNHGKVPPEHSVAWHKLKLTNPKNKDGSVRLISWTKRPIVLFIIKLSALVMSIGYIKKDKLKQKIRVVYQIGMTDYVIRRKLGIKKASDYFTRAAREVQAEK